MQKLLFVPIFFSLLLAEARGAIITGVTATASPSLGTLKTTDIDNLTNGNGLSSLSTEAAHSNDWQTMWLSNLDGTTGSLVFDLGGTYNVDTIAFWNYNGITGSSSYDTFGVKDFSIETSTNGIDYTLLFESSLSMAGGGAEPAQVFGDFGVVTATHVRMNIANNYGGNHTGLSEVQFVEATIPEPSTYIVFAGFISCFGLAVWWRRRRRQAA